MCAGYLWVMSNRSFQRVQNTPPPEPGFIGEGHTAVEVLTSTALEQSDPFVLLMDDRLDIAQRRVIGGAHPHAGLETVTLLLEGTLYDRDEGELHAGDALWMTAGRGIIHNEHVEAEGRARVLQLWVRLPKAARAAAPRYELIRRGDAPVVRESGAVAVLYSGSTGSLTSPTRNHVPVTLVDVSLEPGASFSQALPDAYAGFAYVLEGSVNGLGAGQVGWLDAPPTTGEGVLRLTAGPSGGRLVLYAGQPQREPLIHYGPFVADDERVLAAQFQDFRAGRFTRLSELSR